MAVDPRQLLDVEDARAVTDAFQRESPGHLVERHQLLAAAGRPPDEREVVDERLRQVAARAEFGDGRRAVTLRERRVIGAKHERQMREARRRPAECLVQQHLARRVRDVILAADHVRDSHQRVVDDDREVVRGRAVRPQQYRIADDVRRDRHRAPHGVVETDISMVRDAEADDRALAGLQARARRRGFDPATSAHVARRLTGRERGLSIGLELFLAAETVVGAAVAEQSIGVRPVNGHALRLAIRAMAACAVGSLVPVESQPAQVVQDRPFRFSRRALAVGVLDAQHEPSALSPSEQPVEQRRAGVADVQEPGGAGGEAEAHGKAK